MKAVTAVGGSVLKFFWFMISSVIYVVALAAYHALRIAFRFLQSVLVAIAFAFLAFAYFNATPDGKSKIGRIMQWVVGEAPKQDADSKRKQDADSKRKLMATRVRAGGKNKRTKVYDKAFGR